MYFVDSLHVQGARRPLLLANALTPSVPEDAESPMVLVPTSSGPTVPGRAASIDESLR